MPYCRCGKIRVLYIDRRAFGGSTYFSLRNIPKVREVDTLTFWQCSFHDKLLSICTPRNFVFSTCRILEPLNLISRLTCVVLFEKNIQDVFFRLTDNMLLLNHLDTLINSLLIIVNASFKWRCLKNILVSSANNIKESNLEEVHKSLI